MSAICRACLEIVNPESFFYIDTFDNCQFPNTVPKHLLQLCIPEMDLYTSENPGICQHCLTQFESFYNFKNRCLASEEKIQTYIEKHAVSSQSKVDLASVIREVFDTPEKDTSEQKPNELLVDLSKFVESLQPKKYKCDHCNYTTPRKYRLACHVNSKHVNPEINLSPKPIEYECQNCAFKTVNLNTLKRHTKEMHSNNPFCCHLCPCTFPLEAPFKRHLAKHGIRVYACPTCDYRTNDPSNFKKHCLIHDKKCTKCNYQCGTAKRLLRHYRNEHV